MRPTALPFAAVLAATAALALALAACGPKPGAGGPGAAGPSASAASAAAAAAAASAPSLLVAPEDTLTVALTRVAQGPVISGSVQPAKRADLRAEVAAVVLQVLKDNGEPVRAGEVLVRLDETAIRDSLTSAEESLRVATLAQDQAERSVQRLVTLREQGMTSAQALEDAQVRRNQTTSDVAAARSRVVAAQQQLARTVVRAPFEGVVSERKASAGDTAQIGKELLKVIDPRSMRFEGLVSAERLQDLQVGQPVAFRVNGFSEQTFRGRLQRIDASVNATTRQVAVIATFDDPSKAPRVAGLFAEGRIETGGSMAVSLPESAVVRTGDNAQVWRIEGRRLRQVPVVLGDRDPRSGEWVVSSGVQAGEVLLRNPGSNLKDGQALTLVAPGAANLAASAARPATPATAASAASR